MQTPHLSTATAGILTWLGGLKLDDESSWMQKLCPLSKSRGVDVKIVRGILKAKGDSLCVTPGNYGKEDYYFLFLTNLYFHIRLKINNYFIPHSDSWSTKKQHIT